MLGLDKKSLTFLKQYYPEFTLRKNEFSYHRGQESATVPSPLYPVSNKPTMKVFCTINTEQKPSVYEKKDIQKLIQIYNRLSFKIGHCYSNTEALVEEIQKQGLQDVETYVGWLFLQGSGLPIHHSWAVYKGNFVLDSGVTKMDDELRIKMMNGEFQTPEQYREANVQLHLQYKDVPNFEKSTFGQVAPFAVYVGTQMKPNQGRRFFNELIDANPNHPAYASNGMNAHGASTSQLMIDEALHQT